MFIEETSYPVMISVPSAYWAISQKLILKIKGQRIIRLCGKKIRFTQFGFQNTVCTREALFSIQILF